MALYWTLFNANGRICFIKAFDGWRLVGVALFRKFPVLKEWAFLFTNIYRCYVSVTTPDGECTFGTVLMITAQIFVIHALQLKFYWHILTNINIPF
jgi:hypothetical protein